MNTPSKYGFQGYYYACKNCGHIFNSIDGNDQRVNTCPKCGDEFLWVADCDESSQVLSMPVPKSTVYEVRTDGIYAVERSGQGNATIEKLTLVLPRTAIIEAYTKYIINGQDIQNE